MAFPKTGLLATVCRVRANEMRVRLEETVVEGAAVQPAESGRRAMRRNRSKARSLSLNWHLSFWGKGASGSSWKKNTEL